MQSRNLHHNQAPTLEEDRRYPLATDITLGGLQTALDLFQNVAGNLGVPALQTGVRAVSTVLKAIQARNNHDRSRFCALIIVHQIAIS